jgi:hypothetical protein
MLPNSTPKVKKVFFTRAQSTLSQQLTILPREDQEKVVGGHKE